MGFDATEGVIVARWEAQWSALQPDIPYTYENEGEDDFPPKGGSWVRLTVLNGLSNQVAMGDTRLFRRVGTVEIQIFTPAGSGSGLATRLGDTVRDIFEGRTISGVVFRATSLSPARIDGVWNQRNASTPFQADELR